MDKNLKDIIDKVSKIYGVELIDVEKEEDAGIFVDVDGKKVNISDAGEVGISYLFKGRDTIMEKIISENPGLLDEIAIKYPNLIIKE